MLNHVDSVCLFAANTQTRKFVWVQYSQGNKCIDSRHLCNVCTLIAWNCQCPGSVDYLDTSGMSGQRKLSENKLNVLNL